MCRGLPLPIHTPWTLQLLSLAVQLYSLQYSSLHPSQIGTQFKYSKSDILSIDMTAEAENPKSSLHIVELISSLPVG